MTSPETLLADPSWRHKHSIYLIWSWLALGFIGFFYTGIRARENRWLLWGVVYATLVIGGIALTPEPDTDGGLVADLAMVSLLVGWIASAVHLYRERKAWLRWKAAASNASPWYETSPSPLNRESSPPAALDPLGMEDPTGEFLAGPAHTSGVSPPTPPPRRSARDEPAPPSPRRSAESQEASASSGVSSGTTGEPAGPGLLDLNTATVDEIAELPGVGIAIAHRIVEQRTRQGSFSSVDDAAIAVGLKPHVRSRLQQHATASHRPRTPPGGGTHGRIVDI